MAKENKKVVLSLTIEPSLKQKMEKLRDKTQIPVSQLLSEASEDILKKYQEEGVHVVVDKEEKGDRDIMGKDGKQHKCVSIVLANDKGGVAKTTTALAMSNILAENKKKVLLVDLDQQRNATDLIRLGDNHSNIYDYFIQYIDYINGDDDQPEVQDFIVPSKYPNLDVICGSPKMLARVGISITEASNKLDNVFTLMLEDLKQMNVYDYVIFDTHPGLEDITLRCIDAVDYTISPVFSSREAFEGAVKIVKYINMKKRRNTVSKFLGMLFTCIDVREGLSRQIPEIKEYAKNEYVIDNFFKTFIDRSAKVGALSWTMEPIAERPNTKTYKKYKAFVSEMEGMINE